MENIEIIGTFSPGIILIILYYYYYKISVTVISSDKKILNLVVNDYLYQKYKIHKDKIHYRCSKAKSGHVKCKSTVKLLAYHRLIHRNAYEFQKIKKSQLT